MNLQNKSNMPWWQGGMQLFLQLSSWIIGPILLAIIVGKFLDKFFHTDPWIFLITIIVTFVFSIFKIIRIGLREMEKENRK